MSETKSAFKPGVVTGDNVSEIFRIANENNYALPAVNVVGTNSVNAVLETAKTVNSPVMIQFSNGGSIFLRGQEPVQHRPESRHRRGYFGGDARTPNGRALRRSRNFAH